MFCSRVLYVLLSTPGSIFETSWLAVDITPLSLRRNRISGRLLFSLLCAHNFITFLMVNYISNTTRKFFTIFFKCRATKSKVSDENRRKCHLIF